MNEPRPPQTAAAAPAPAADGSAPPRAGTGTPSIAEILATDAPPAAPPPRRALTVRNYAWIAGAALTVFVGLRYLGPVLTPFLIGAILAYLGTPIVTWAAGKGVPRGLTTTLVVLLFGLILIALFLVLIPLVQAEVMLAAQRLPELAAQATGRITPWLQQQFGITLALDFESIKALVAENMDEARGLSLQVLAGVKSGGLILVAVLVNLVLIPVVMFYLLRDWDMIGERVYALVPRTWLAKVRTIGADIDGVLAEFLRGQLLVMLVLAAYYAVALSLAGLDRAVAIGVLTGLLVFIPYVGFGIGSDPRRHRGAAAVERDGAASSRCSPCTRSASCSKATC